MSIPPRYMKNESYV